MQDAKTDADGNITGKCAIVLQVSHKKQRKQVFTGLYIDPKNFTDGVVVKIPNAAQYNQLITTKRNEIEKEYLNQQISDGAVSLNFSKGHSKKDFFAYAISHYRSMSDRCSADYINRCVWAIEDFQTFAGNRSFQGITFDLLKQYEKHLFDRPVSRNTINRIFKKIKQVFLAAGVPWRYKAVTYKQPKRDFLTMEEITDIENNGRDHVVKWYFLLSCYSGLRYSDMQGIEKKVVKNKGVRRLILGTTKTNEVISIKVTPKISKCLGEINGPIPTNVGTNRILKDIITDTSIKRPVNFHMGRHSFAVNAASMGFPIEVVSKLLGHNSIRTTQIYYKITDTKVDEWMDKWG